MMRYLSASLLFSIPASAAVDFAHDVVPVLRQYCADCHLGDKRKAGLSMNTRADLLTGSENGKVVEPGKPDEGSFLKLLTSTDSDEWMPPKGDRVPPEKIAILRAWVAEGLPWEDGFTFGKTAWEPPLKPRKVELPPPVEGRGNPVDRIIDHYCTAHNVTRPETVDDAAFIRRLSMDVIGLLPEPDAVTAFAADKTLGKRERLIAATLSRKTEYAEHWLTFWNDLLRNDYQGTGYIDGGRQSVTAWLYKALLTNMPYDQFAKELLAPPTKDSAGFIQGIKWRGNVNASQVREIQFSQSVSQVFLGINMKCASCHDSFVDRWKLEDAYALAAVYSETPLEMYRCDKATGRQAKAGWIFPELGSIDVAAPQPERLKQLAGLMTHPENGRFTRTIVNRIWHRLMGRGIVHPVDAMHTEPWSADLLDWLSVWFADNQYDVKKLITLICTSQAWQARTVAGPEETEKYVFRGPIARRLTAEQFVDAVWKLTDTAPAAPHKSIPRASMAAGKPAGHWIWSSAEASTSAPAGETITVRKEFTLPAASKGGRAVVSCDNSCEVFLDGRSLVKHDNWEAPSAIVLPELTAGAHTFTIAATNGGDGPNPAGVFFSARLPQEGRPPLNLGTDKTWTWAVKDEPGATWAAAAEAKGQGVWARVNGALQEAVTLTAANNANAVRASTVPSDLLMRALGRPNREQIVSMRPENLTTLEAIDLANGNILAGLLRRGAEHILSTWKSSARDLAGYLGRRALTRSLTPEEAELLTATLGEKPTAQSIEDALWLLLMLPEFQFVR